MPKRYLRSAVLLSLMLGLTSCGLFKSSHPPCNEEDVQMAYDAQGQPRKEGLFMTWGCYDRMRGDLRACYEGKAQ